MHMHTCTPSQKSLTQHNHFWGHKGHYKKSLELQGPSELHVISWSKVPENSLETQAGMLGSQGSGLIISVFPISDQHLA